MAQVVLDLRKARSAGELPDAVHRAVQALSEGQVVAVPTETVYGLAASALDAAAVERISEVKGRKEGNPYALVVKSLQEALDYAPDLPPLAERLARRCWPGPVTIVASADHPQSLVHRLPPSVLEAVRPSGTVGFRVPASEIVHETLRLMAGPIVLTSANRSGDEPATTAEQVVQSLGDDVPLVLDDGRCQFSQASTVVRVEGQTLHVLREGVVSAGNLRRLASLMVLFVCTGNTCRSPMAEALARAQVAKRLGCADGEVEDRGVVVTSAGISAMTGGNASPEAVDVVSRRGLDLGMHLSQPLRLQLVQQADVVFTMTHGHRAAIVSQWPEFADKVSILSANGEDVSDPIGGSPELYEQCANQIDALIAKRLESLDLTPIDLSVG